MSGPRCDRMLAGTALALLLAAPFGVSAQEAAKSRAIASPATEASPPPAIPAGEPPTASINTDPAAPAAPAAVTEETAAPDPLASLDPADRVVAEKIHDLLAATPDKIFASKNEKAAVEKFYQGRNLAPLWLDKGIENARARPRLPALRRPKPMGSMPAIIARRISQGLPRTRWRRLTSSLRRRCSPSPVISRPGVFPTHA